MERMHMNHNPVMRTIESIAPGPFYPESDAVREGTTPDQKT